MKISVLLLATSFVIGLILLVVRLLLFLKYLKRPYTILEITPPHTIEKGLGATKEFIQFLSSLAMPSASFFSMFLTSKKMYALEIVSTKEKGIRYVLRIPKEDVPAIKKGIHSFLPYFVIDEISEYLPIENSYITTPNKSWAFAEMKLANHFSLPLTVPQNGATHSFSYLLGNFTNVNEKDLVCMQILFSPLTSTTHRKLTRVVVKLLIFLEMEYDISPLLGEKGLLRSIVTTLISFITKVIKGLCNIVLFPLTFLLYLFTFGKTNLFFFTTSSKHQHIFLTKSQKLLYQSLQEKLSSSLCEVSLRFLVISDTDGVKSIMEGLRSSLFLLSSSYQSFTTKKTIPFLGNWINLFRLKQRFLSFSNPILSVDELAGIYHLPNTTIHTEGLVRVKSKILPLSLEMKNTSLSFHFAKNTYSEGGLIGLTPGQRRRHVYVLGATGTGKTTMLATMIYQDIVRGKGLCVIDPHGDLIEKLLTLIPQNRMKDTILFDPSDIDYPIGLNLLELPKSYGSLEKEKDFVASSMVSVFSKLTSGKYWGPRMENILRVTTLTALTTPSPTLFTLQRLLLDTPFRKSIVDRLIDPALLLFWKKEFNQMGLWQRSSMTSPITNKVGRFLTSPLSKYILCQKTSKLDFEYVLNSGKILLCNLSKGKIGEDTSALFGALITAKIQLAALKRASIPESERKDFYVYIDEFQNFATPSFSEIMSEARKYRLNAILAHQTIAQIEDHSLTKVILANTGTVISFRASSPVDQEFILPFFAPLVEKADLANLPSFNFYMKINAPIPQDAFSGETIPVTEKDNQEIRDQIIQYSRKRYGTKREIIASEIQQEYQALVGAEVREREEKLHARRQKAEEKRKKMDETEKRYIQILNARKNSQARFSSSE